MAKLAILATSAIGVLLLASAASPQDPPGELPAGAPLSAAAVVIGQPRPLLNTHAAPLSLKQPEPVPPPPPTPREALEEGILIVVSLASQQAFVFKDGQVWDSTQVSTGKPGHDTPEGVFTILQKKVRHRSTLYDDAPMPFMQRLTWDGVALHAGRTPGYPASHGCVRLPNEFAEKLYEITNFSSTVVIVTGEQVDTSDDARRMA